MWKGEFSGSHERYSSSSRGQWVGQSASVTWSRRVPSAKITGQKGRSCAMVVSSTDLTAAPRRVAAVRSVSSDICAQRRIRPLHLRPVEDRAPASAPSGGPPPASTPRRGPPPASVPRRGLPPASAPKRRSAPCICARSRTAPCICARKNRPLAPSPDLRLASLLREGPHSASVRPEEVAPCICALAEDRPLHLRPAEVRPLHLPQPRCAPCIVFDEDRPLHLRFVDVGTA
jgi:hypothetical protein